MSTLSLEYPERNISIISLFVRGSGAAAEVTARAAARKSENKRTPSRKQKMRQLFFPAGEKARKRVAKFRFRLGGLRRELVRGVRLSSLRRENGA